MSFGWVGSGYECMNGHFKMEILKTSFHDINPHLMHLFYPQISTHSRMFRTNSSAGGWVWNCVAPEKGMNVKTLITPPLTHVRLHTHTQPTVFFSQSFAILPSLPNVELLRCVNSTRVVERRKVSAHPLWPPSSQIIFITQLSRVIRAKTQDSPLHRHGALRKICWPAERFFKN